jgi:hypothetical protein
MFSPSEGGVDRRGQARGSAPDDGQVVHLLRQRLAQADRLRQLPVRGIAEEELAPEGDDRSLGRRQPEALQELVHLGVDLQVQPRERHPVGGQEVPDPKRVHGVPRADHAQAGEAARFAKELPAGDERLQDDVGQVRALVQDLAQGVGGDFVDLAIASLEVGVADLDQDVPVGIALERRGGAAGEGGDLRVVQNRKGDGVQIWPGHAPTSWKAYCLTQRHLPVARAPRSAGESVRA